MAAPLKRPSLSPPPATSDSASLPKVPRLHLDSTASSSSASTSQLKAARAPKGATNGAVGRDKQPQELVGAEEQLVDQQLEVEDAQEYAQALLALQTVFNRLHHPTRLQLRMLIALSLFPLLFKPPTKSTNAALSKRRPPPSSSLTKPSSASSSAPTASDDPLAPGPTLDPRRLRAQALMLLASVVETSGTRVVCRAVRGAGVPESPAERAARAQQEQEQGEGSEAAERAAKKAKSSSSRRRTAAADSEAEEDDLSPSDDDDALVHSAKRLGGADDLWDVLGGTTARRVRVRSRERPVVEGGGWRLVRVLVRGWEREHALGVKEKQAEDPPAPLSLLRYFPLSASTSAARETSPKALDVVFWPFSAAAQPGAAGESTSDEDEESEGDVKKKGKKDEVEGDDGMGLAEKRETAVRLLGLMGASAIDGYLDGSSLIAEVVSRLKALQHDDFVSFLEALPLYSVPAPFLSRLLTTYLDAHSHPLALTASLLPPTASSTLAPSSSGPTSPRKRLLEGSASHASLDSTGTATGTAVSQLQLQAALWVPPALNSPELTAAVSRVALEVPLPPPPPSSSVSSDAATARRPRTGAGLPKTFARAAAAAESHTLVKHALLALLAQEGEVGEERRKELGAVMKGVESRRRRGHLRRSLHLPPLRTRDRCQQHQPVVTPTSTSTWTFEPPTIPALEYLAVGDEPPHRGGDEDKDVTARALGSLLLPFTL
ncbi:hypothetical protein JCM10207_001482 [Rhodosporidiobolus poonsookiae]